MHAAEYIRVPLRRRDGSIAAHAVIDAEDAHLVVHRWSLNRGYAVRSLPSSGGKRRTVQLHRVVLGLVIGDGRQCDHIDGDRLNCRRANLRVVTNAQNKQNRSSQAGSSSRYRGVSWHKQCGKWLAHATLNGVRRHLGYFDDELEAAAAASAWRLAHMPFTNEARAAASEPTVQVFPMPAHCATVSSATYLDGVTEMGTYTTGEYLDLFGGLPDRGEAAVDPRELADLQRDEADEHGSGPVVCAACDWRQGHGGACDRCGETPSSIAAAEADHAATRRADRWL